ncbi:MAG: diaminopimelate decarboxylase [Muribaculaceae bacterium]|nr:diaminopimelate decarboxylase [Muribaculaceae bacterium]
MGQGFNHQVFRISDVGGMRTPFYYYDISLLRATLDEVTRLTAGGVMRVHYAVKANFNPRILREIASSGLGADLVSGGEVKAAVEAGFKPQDLAFSGVGKTDWEIRLGLDYGIGCFNVESIPEMEVINELAGEMGVTARVAIRVNPDIDAHTHKYITTGTAANKFGISMDALDDVIDRITTLPHVHLRGLHFHIGSQITQMAPFEMLCDTVNRLQDRYEERGIRFEMINVGGGLGVDYDHPDEHPMADLECYFSTFKRGLRLREGQELHFELGRAIVASCGSLISRVTFVKENRDKKFAILDAGMTDLIRPALYQAHHQVQNLTSTSAVCEPYDVVGPVCESSDVFAHDCLLPLTRRGDLVAIRTAGAYGESMASTYNLRALPGCAFSD